MPFTLDPRLLYRGVAISALKCVRGCVGARVCCVCVGGCVRARAWMCADTGCCRDGSLTGTHFFFALLFQKPNTRPTNTPTHAYTYTPTHVCHNNHNHTHTRTHNCSDGSLTGIQFLLAGFFQKAITGGTERQLTFKGVCARLCVCERARGWAGPCV